VAVPRRRRRRQQQFDRLAPAHADRDAERLGLGRRVHDLGVEQVFGVDERLLRRSAGDGDGLAEFRGRLHVVDAAADQPGFGQDGAVLTLAPAVADADGLSLIHI